MKIKSFLIFGLIIGVVSLFAFYPKNNADPIEKEAIILRSVLTLMDKVHFKPKDINDDFSKKIYKNFLTTLDGGKRFLTQSDIDQLKQYETTLDDNIKVGNFDFFNKSVELITKAQTKTQSFYKDILSKPMSFDKNEFISYDFDNMPYAKTDKELKERWFTILKSSVLDEVVQMENSNSKDSVKTEGKETKEVKTFAQIEKEAREKVLKDYDKLYERLGKLRRDDRFSDYINSITEVFDPHSSYFNQNDKNDFDVSFSGKVEGIGAKLQSEGEFTKVTEIVVGGPAWKQKDLEANDVIMKVAQDGQDALDIRGMRIDDVVSKIRGKKGTKVTLTVKKVNGAIQNITILRDEVLMEESFAKSAIVGKKGVMENVGYIYLPKFYADFDNNKGRFSFTDVAIEVNKLKKQGVNGIILDLRNNPGGSLNDVVKMGGLFIEEGPIVQVKSRGQEPYVMSDDDSGYGYDGPMVVLVNHQSASASEILAAALQDYKRAVIIGSTSTYGKGTVQRFLDLDKSISISNEFKPLGQVKVTIQKYYRINGGSTQLEGVVPDIVLPDALNYVKVGERENESAMEWTKVEPAKYSQDVFVIKNLEEVKANSKNRTANNPTFVAIDNNAKNIKIQSERKEFPLEIKAYKEDIDTRKASSKKFNDLFVDIDGFEDGNLDADLAQINKDSVSIGRNINFLKGLKKDVYIDEAINVIKDLQVNRVTMTDKTRYHQE